MNKRRDFYVRKTILKNKELKGISLFIEYYKELYGVDITFSRAIKFLIIRGLNSCKVGMDLYVQRKENKK